MTTTIINNTENNNNNNINNIENSKNEGKQVTFKFGNDEDTFGDITFNVTVHQLLEHLKSESISTTLPICPNESMKAFERDYKLPMISIAVCMKNASKFLDETLFSVIMQTYKGPLELSIFDDASTDSSYDIVLNWLPVFKYFKIIIVLSNKKFGTKIFHHDIKEYIDIVNDFNIKNNISINDNSNNENENKIKNNEKEENGIITILSGGVGYARNQAIKYSHGEFLCILDADDVMFRERIEIQYRECGNGIEKENLSKYLIGSNYIRIPIGSSARYTDWCNRLTDNQLYLHQFREVTIIQPTWFYHRSLFEKNGKYIEALKMDDVINHNNNYNSIEKNTNHNNNINNNNNNNNNSNNDNQDNFYLMGNNDNVCQYKHKNQDKHIEKYKESQLKFIKDLNNSGAKAIPEDLIFFNRHLDKGGILKKAKIESSIYNNNENSDGSEEVGDNKKLKIEKFEPLLVYRYHENNLSGQIHKHMLMKVRIEYLERRVLSNWKEFTIWGAGKDGKKFFTLLPDSCKKKVIAFCDVDKNKIGINYNAAYTPYSIPIIHFSNVKSPLIICVALDRSNGEFENNLNSLNLIEGKDYWHFN
ncbi:hypothetical protein ACTFIV_005624 [Dictyostelium citrinum]